MLARHVFSKDMITRASRKRLKVKEVRVCVKLQNDLSLPKEICKIRYFFDSFK